MDLSGIGGRSTTYRFVNGRIGEIRPFILLGLGGVFFQAFLNSVNSFVDVVDDMALALEFLFQLRCSRLGILELLSKVVVDFLDILADSGLAAEGLPDHEAEGGRHQHP